MRPVSVRLRVFSWLLLVVMLFNLSAPLVPVLAQEPTESTSPPTEPLPHLLDANEPITETVSFPPLVDHSLVLTETLPTGPELIPAPELPTLMSVGNDDVPPVVADVAPDLPLPIFPPVG
ncbi:MAG: hypothetical protein H0T73_10150, partial [Ardenticatenales bacterium]|nr:hypothetical protein [Ardenticatenales bacterium]